MIKSECRKLFSEKRKELSESILNRLLDTIDLKNKTVSLFLPIESKKEINTYPLLNLKKELNIRFALPVADFNTNEMIHYLYENSEQLATNNYGIPEPVYGTKIESKNIDVVIIPLLCFDKKGYRVGYGKGFYDRFLMTCRPDCQFIGLSFFEPIDKIGDVTEYDIALQKAITSQQNYSFI
jgi:5-formyltetrahydrofolate cyclo-ligase